MILARNVVGPQVSRWMRPFGKASRKTSRRACRYGRVEEIVATMCVNLGVTQQAVQRMYCSAPPNAAATAAIFCSGEQLSLFQSFESGNREHRCRGPVCEKNREQAFYYVVSHQS